MYIDYFVYSLKGCYVLRLYCIFEYPFGLGMICVTIISLDTAEKEETTLRN